MIHLVNKQRFLCKQEKVEMHEDVKKDGKKRLLILSQYRILIYSLENLITEPRSTPCPQPYDQNLLKQQTALSVWPIRSCRCEINEEKATLYFKIDNSRNEVTKHISFHDDSKASLFKKVLLRV